MRKIRRTIGLSLLIAAAASGVCLAQDKQDKQDKKTQDMLTQAQELLELRQELKDMKAVKAEPKFYKLTFVVKEMDGGKVVNARSYSMLVSTTSNNSIRSGEKIPITVESMTQIFDVGTNVDCRNVRPIQNELSMDVTVDASGIAQETPATARPVIRSYRWNAGVLIPLNKPTVIFSSDHVSDKGQMQVELTAAPVQ